MLTDAELHLLTAAADGELPAEKQPALARLLAASPAAAALHRRLVADRARLRALPIEPAPESIFAAVMATVTAPPAAVVRRPVRRSSWFPAAIAASALLVVGGGGSFLFFQPKGSVPLAGQAQVVVPKPAEPSVAPRVIAFNAEPPAGFTGPPKPEPAAVASAAPVPRERGPAPRPSGDGVLASPVGPPVKPFAGVDLKLPLLMPVSDLAAATGKKQFLDELPADGAVRIDLFAADTLKGIDVLSVAARAAHLTWTYDGLTGERHKMRVPMAYAVFTESLTPGELAEFITAASTSDWQKGFTSIHVFPPAAPDFKDWKDLTGSEPPVAKKTKLDTKHLSAGTVDQVTSALQKAQKPEKSALVLTYLPAANRVNPLASKEVVQFNAKRAEKKPGTLSVMIVVRPVSQ